MFSSIYSLYSLSSLREHLQKISEKTFFGQSKAAHALQTLHIKLKQESTSEIYTLKIKQTHWESKASKHLSDWKWTTKGILKDFKKLETMEHPWQEYLEVKYDCFNGLSLYCHPQVINSSQSYIPYNYVIDSPTNVTLKHITTTGYVDVRQSKNLTTPYVEGQAGIRLKSHGKIHNSDIYCGFKPSQILSKGDVILQAQRLDNHRSTILGNEVFGCFDGPTDVSKSTSAGVWNACGKIQAKRNVRLHSTSSISNFQGLIQAKFGQVGLTTDKSFKNGQGAIKSHHHFALLSQEEIENGSGLMESTAGQIYLSAGKQFHNFFGIVKSREDLELRAEGHLENWSGLIDSKLGKTTVITEGPISNFTGRITSEKQLHVYTWDSINNHGGLFESREDSAHITAMKSLENKMEGQILGKKKVDLNVNHTLIHSNAKIGSQGEIDIQADDLKSRSRATIAGKNVKINVTHTFECPSTALKAEREFKLTAQKVTLQSTIISRYVSIKATQELNLEASQSAEYLSLELHNCPFVYKEDQLQATHRLFIKSNRELDLKTPLKIKGRLEITAHRFYNHTLLVADGSITLTANSTIYPFPVWNSETIVSNKGSITIHSQGLRHGFGKIGCAGHFKFEGKNIQILYPLNVGKDTHLFVPDQADIEAKKCKLGSRSYIDYTQLSVQGLLHLTLPNHFKTFPRDFKTPGSLLLEKKGRGMNGFRIYYDLIAPKGIKVKMPKERVQVGSREFSAIKIQSKEGYLEVDARSLDIPKAKIYTKTGIAFKVKEKQLHIGRGVETDVEMVTYSGWTGDYYAKIFNYSFPVKSSNGTLLTTEGDFTIESPSGVLIDTAEIILHRPRYWNNGKGNWTIHTSQPVQNKGGKINIPGTLSIFDPLKKSHPDSNAVLNNSIEVKTVVKEFHYSWNNSKVTCTLSYPYTQPAEIKIGKDLLVEAFENFGSTTYIAGELKNLHSSRRIRVIEEDFLPSAKLSFSSRDFEYYFTGGTYHHNTKLSSSIQQRYSSNVTLGKAVVLDYSGTEKHAIEGVLQAPRIVIQIHEGKLQVGKSVNYKRPATRPFEQLKMFLDVYRPSTLFKASFENNKPWVHKPVFPLSFNPSLPPAVVVTSKGFRLMKPCEKFLFHPLEEIDTLPSVFEAQIKRGCLDWEHTDTWQTYQMGRQAAYDVYQELYEPKALTDKAEESNSQALTKQQHSQTLSTTMAGLSDKVRDQLKFMVVYSAGSYEGRKVYLPISWVSPSYDDAKMRNPDGGIFAEELALCGLSDEASVHNFSTLKGNQLLDIDVNLTNERTSYRWIEYRTNTSSKKGGLFQSDKYSCEIVAITCTEAQSDTGIVCTGPQGKLKIKAKVFDNVNGAELQVGTEGAHFQIETLKSSSAIDVSAQTFQGSAGGTSITRHVGAPTILPAVFTSTGGFHGTIDKLLLDGTKVIAIQKNITLQLTGGHLGCTIADKPLSLSVTKEGKAVVVEEKTTQIAMPCGFLALEGDVHLTIKEKLTGDAPLFYGNLIILEGQVDFESLLLKTVTKRESVVRGFFSSTKSTSRQESSVPVRAIFEGREVTFRNGKARLGGAYIKAAVRIVDETPSGIVLEPTVNKMYFHQNSKVSSPLAHGEVGTEGWQEVMIPPTIDTPEIVRSSPKGKMSFTSLDFDPQTIKIKGKFETKKRELQRWQRSWNHQHQAIPQGAMYAISLAASYFIGPYGLALGKAMFGANAAASVVFQAGFQAFCAHAATSLARSGDPLHAWQEVTSAESLRGIAEAMISAGILHKMAPVLQVNMKPGLKEIGQNARKFGLINAVKVGMHIGFGAKPEEALKAGVRKMAVQVAGAWVAGQVGSHLKENAVNLAAHAVVGGGMAKALGEDVASGAAGAILNEFLAKQFIDPQAIQDEVEAEGHLPEEQAQAFEDKRQEQFQHIRMLAAGLIGLAGGNAAIADEAGENALNHNFALHEGAAPFDWDDLRIEEVFDEDEIEDSAFNVLEDIALDKALKKIEKSAGSMASNITEYLTTVFLESVDKDSQSPVRDTFLLAGAEVGVWKAIAACAGSWTQGVSIGIKVSNEMGKHFARELRPARENFMHQIRDFRGLDEAIKFTGDGTPLLGSLDAGLAFCQLMRLPYAGLKEAKNGVFNASAFVADAVGITDVTALQMVEALAKHNADRLEEAMWQEAYRCGFSEVICEMISDVVANISDATAKMIADMSKPLTTNIEQTPWTDLINCGGF